MIPPSEATAMPSLLNVRNLAKSHPSNLLFEGVDLQVASGERIGLIGPNGAGKSTLMRILAGVDTPDAGEVARQKGTTQVYVSQDDRFPDDATPMSAVAAELDDDGRLDPETRAAIVLSRLGFEDFERSVSTLSGGWRKRLSLACALAHEPDVLMLDEPTNHLDLEGVVWLEQFVKQSNATFMFVTHDRRFLENTATRVIELSKAYPGGTFEAEGNYTNFIRRKEDFLEAQAAAQSVLANRVRRDTAWLRQGIQGRQTRNKTQVDDATTRRGELKAIKDRNAAPTKATTIDFQATDRKTKRLLALHGVAKSMGGKRLFEGLDLTLTPGRRLGLVGVNGSGKTTLLRLMSGELEPDAGTIKRAAELRTVVFSQHRGTLVAEQTLQEALCPVGDMVDFQGRMVHVSGWAKRFLFEPDQLSTYVGNLSGGEQARVLIANLMLDPADVLLLDEPTNDLDIPSLEVLEEALLDFPGALVLVTHDRFMLERIATEYVGLDDAGGAKIFQTHQQWTEHRARETASARGTGARSNVKAGATSTPGSASPAAATESARRGRKLSYKEQREHDGMEEAILEAETEAETLEVATTDPAVVADHAKAAAAFETLSTAQEKVRLLYARWAELESIQSGE